jgi:hypothetical protein
VRYRAGSPNQSLCAQSTPCAENNQGVAVRILVQCVGEKRHTLRSGELINRGGAGIHMPEVIFKNIRLSSPHEIIAVTARVPEINLSPVRIVTGMSLAQIPTIVKQRAIKI